LLFNVDTKWTLTEVKEIEENRVKENNIMKARILNVGKPSQSKK